MSQQHNGGEAAETFVSDVRKFTQAVGCTTDRFNVRQTALYIGLQLEETAEKIESLLDGLTDNGEHESAIPVSAMRLLHLRDILHDVSMGMKTGEFDMAVAYADSAEMLDADIDLAWVTIGSALSQGADVLGAMREVARANLDKIGPDGEVMKDGNGKVIKPEGWRAPDISPFICADVRKAY